MVAAAYQQRLAFVDADHGAVTRTPVPIVQPGQGQRSVCRTLVTEASRQLLGVGRVARRSIGSGRSSADLLCLFGDRAREIGRLGEGTHMASYPKHVNHELSPMACPVDLDDVRLLEGAGDDHDQE